MGLDDFTTDSGTSSNKSSSKNKSKVKLDETQNNPGYATASFADEDIATPRAIKFQLESYGFKWKKQFTRLRMDSGEMVMHTAGANTSKDGKAVMVFTTIDSAIDEKSGDLRLDIWVVPWDLSSTDNLGEGTHVEPEPDWNEYLGKAVVDEMNNLEEYL
jgi:hypothetical protein